jgi:hypothetical protein
MANTFTTLLSGALLFGNLDDPPIDLSDTIQYTGNRLFCGVSPVGSRLDFVLTDEVFRDGLKMSVGQRLESQIAGMDAVRSTGTRFKTATLSLTYQGKTAHLAETSIQFGGNTFTYTLRTDRNFETAAVYIVEDEISVETRLEAERVSEFRKSGEDDTVSDPHLTYIAIRDELVSAMPYSLVHIYNDILLPETFFGCAARPIVYKTDGGSEVGPMGYGSP